MEKNTAEVANRALDIVEKSGAAIHDAVAQLASSLGVAAEHVYAVLVRQQVIDGIVTLSFCVFALITTATLGLWWYSGYKQWRDGEPKLKDGYLTLKEKPYEERTLWTSVGYAAICVAVTVAVFSSAPSAIKKIYNPEYYAIQQAAQMAGKILGK